MPILVGVLVGSLAVAYLRRLSRPNKTRQRPFAWSSRPASEVFLSELRPYIV